MKEDMVPLTSSLWIGLKNSSTWRMNIECAASCTNFTKYFPLLTENCPLLRSCLYVFLYCSGPYKIQAACSVYTTAAAATDICTKLSTPFSHALIHVVSIYKYRLPSKTWWRMMLFLPRITGRSLSSFQKGELKNIDCTYLLFVHARIFYC